MKTNYYEAIRELRNKAFPPKLELGCEVSEDANGGWENMIVVGNTFMDEDKQIKKTIECAYSYGTDITEHFCATWFRTAKLKILGKPVSLNDVLKLVDHSTVLPIDIYWERVKKIIELIGLEPIKNQKEETLKQLYTLIK